MGSAWWSIVKDWHVQKVSVGKSRLALWLEKVRGLESVIRVGELEARNARVVGGASVV